MKINHFLLPIAVLTALFAACSDDKPKQEEPQAGKPMVIKTVIETRVLKSTFVDNDEMGIYVKSTSDLSSTWYNKLTGVCKATYSSANWKVTPTVELSSSTASIFAYYPFSAQATDPAAVPVNTLAQIDYLYSGAAVSASESSTTANLSMRHAQANFRFNIAKLNYSGAATLQSIQIGNKPGKAAFFTEGALNIATGKITGKAGANTAFTISAINKTITAAGWSTDMPAAMLIPFTPQAAGDVQLNITIDGKSYIIDCPVLTEGFLAGKQYTFTLELSDAGLVLNRGDLTIETWGDTNNTVTGKTSVSFALTTQKANQVITMPDMGTSTGYITFGDNQEADYKPGMEHTYAAPGTYIVQLYVKAKVTEVKFTNITGIDQINLSQIGK